MDLQMFAEEKREQPTQKRRQDARERGQIARSQEIGVLVTLLAGVIALRAFGPYMIETMVALFERLWQGPFEPVTERNVRALVLFAFVETLKMLAPILGVVAGAGLMAELAQVGFLLTGSTISMDLNRINPFEGAKRLFSKRSLVDLAKAVLKFAVVAMGLVKILQEAAAKLPELLVSPLRSTASWSASVVWDMIWRCAWGLLLIAAADYFFQWREHEKNLMMSRHELLEELKQSEGRPEVRQRMRQRQRQMAMGRMMQNLKNADVLVTNPTHFAVALSYDSKMAAPTVVAKGAGWLAHQIRKKASEYGVTTVENAAVARALYHTVDVGEPIPASLYQAVAEILAFVYRLKTAHA